jgi:hypothetical protein
LFGQPSLPDFAKLFPLRRLLALTLGKGGASRQSEAGDES